MKQFNNVPEHIAIIMDGNRRWARARGLPGVAGHKKVADDLLEPLVEHAAELGVKYLTFWAFSTENWQRDPIEVKAIMAILRHSLKTFGERMHRKGIRIRVIGDVSKFATDIQKEIGRMVELTKGNDRITVVFALNYGGRDEILRAVAKWRGNSKSQISNSKLTEEEFEHYLDTFGIPDPEMVVRTGGEQRMSGFLPWQSVYSEYYFPAWMMPEFTPEKLDEVIAEYQSRQRRFGK